MSTTTVAHPDVFVIGAPKAGTTSLSQWMAARPDIFFSKPKEPVFWATDYPRLRQARGFDTEAQYLDLFASEEALSASHRAEGSTVYLYSREAVPNIVEKLGDQARFIVALRKPADLVLSFHRTQQLLLNEDEDDFEKAWRRSLEGRMPGCDFLDAKLVDYQMVGRLGAAVSRLLDVVPRSQVHFVRFDAITDDPRRSWAALMGFLDLPVEPYPDFDVHNPSTRAIRWQLLHRLRYRPPKVLAKPMLAMNRLSMKSENPIVSRLKRTWWREAAKPAVSAQLRQELAAFFADDVALLGQLVGSDLSAWSTV